MDEGPGFDLIRLKNFWKEREYKGSTPNGATGDGPNRSRCSSTHQQSFEAKQITHKAYERLDSVNRPDEESSELHSYQHEVSSISRYQMVRQDILSTRDGEDMPDEVKYYAMIPSER